MIADLRERETSVAERMDDPCCDLTTLHRTYARFRLVNRLVAGWRRTYTERIRPVLSASRASRLLDVGCGGGDVARTLRRWAEADGLRLEVVGIDPDPRALAFVADLPATPGVTFRRAVTPELVAAEERYELVASNHLLHHLDPAGLAGLLSDSERLAGRLVLHSDLRRSVLAYAVWASVSWPAAADSYLYVDGLLSIRRSYAAAELAEVVPAGWQVRPTAPFRLLLTWTAPRG